jgi:phosphatidylglycerol---prolipoprotein diacylglyceryl transferase
MHPILFHIGDFYVGTYGVMIVLGMFAGLAITRHLARRLNLSPDLFYDMAFFVLLAGFLGARLLFILVNFDLFIQAPLSLIFAREGFVFLGGFAAAIVVAVFFVRLNKLPTWDVGDIAGPSLALGHGIGRIGCLLAGCCYGRPVGESLGFLGISFPHVHKHTGETFLSFAWADHVDAGLIPPDAARSLPVYPTQLFESVANGLIFIALMLLWRRRAFSGQIFASYLLLYGAARFLIEYFRGDFGRGVWFDGLLSTSQILSLISIAAGAALWIYLKPSMPIRRAGYVPGK